MERGAGDTPISVNRLSGSVWIREDGYPGSPHRISLLKPLKALTEFSRMTLLRQLLTDDRWLPLRRGMLVALWIVLAISTHIPVPPSAPEIRYLDKVIHLVAYFPLGLLLPTCRVRGCQRGGVCLLVIALYGMIDELLQIPVGRTASVYDWIADMLGASAGFAVAHWFAKPGEVPQNQR